MDRRPRRTAAQVQQAIRQAVRDCIAEGGYAAVSYEGVARRAGTSKPVLYRRYSDRAAMILDAMEDPEASGGRVESSGSLRDDLIALMSALHDRAARLGPDTYRALVGEARDETFARAAAMSTGTLSHLDTHILQPARNRGELGHAPMAPQVVMAPFQLGRDRIIFGPHTGHDVADIVDEVALPLYRAASGLTRS